MSDLSVNLKAVCDMDALLEGQLELMRGAQERKNASLRRFVGVNLACEIQLDGIDYDSSHVLKSPGPRRAHLVVRIPVVAVDAWMWIREKLRAA